MEAIQYVKRKRFLSIKYCLNRLLVDQWRRVGVIVGIPTDKPWIVGVKIAVDQV